MIKQNSTLFSNLIWKFGERFLAQIVSFIVSIVLARMLMPEDYGVISLILVFITFADVFVTSGFSTSLIQKKDADDTDFSTIFYCSFMISILIYFVLFAVAPIIADFYNTPTLIPILRVFSLRIPISSYNSIQHAYVSRNMLFKKFFFSTLFGTILSGVFGVVAAYHGLGAWALIIQYMTNTIVDTIVLRFTIDWHLKIKFSKQSASSLMKYGWKILVADLSGTFFEQLRSLIIGKVYLTSDLAFYNRGKSFSSLIMDNKSTAMMSVLFPDLSNKVDDIQQLKKTLRRSISVMSYVIFPMIGGLVVVAKQLTIVLLTEKWIESVPYLQLLAIAAGISLIGNISLQSIKAIGRSDVVLKLEIIKKPVYIFLLIVGVLISPLAIAFTMVIYSIYSSIANARPLLKLVGYTYKEQIQDIWQSFFMTVIMCLIIWGLRFVIHNYLVLLILQVLIGMILYFILSAVLKNKAYMYVKSLFWMRK